MSGLGCSMPLKTEEKKRCYQLMCFLVKAAASGKKQVLPNVFLSQSRCMRNKKTGATKCVA